MGDIASKKKICVFLESIPSCCFFKKTKLVNLFVYSSSPEVKLCIRIKDTLSCVHLNSPHFRGHFVYISMTILGRMEMCPRYRR